MTGPEVRNMLGIRPPDAPESIDPAERGRMVEVLREVVRDSADPDVRRDAFDLLTDVGEMK